MIFKTSAWGQFISEAKLTAFTRRRNSPKDLLAILRPRLHASGSFWQRIFFIRFTVLGSSPHGDGVFGHRKRSFSKTLPRVDLFEHAVFLLPFGRGGRVKKELFENADVRPSIYHLSEHALGSLGIMQGHFACLFSFIEVRMSNIIIEDRISLWNSEFESHSVFVWTGMFLKMVLLWTPISIIRMRKDAFSLRSGYVWTGPKKESELNDILIHFEEFSNVHGSDGSLNATRSNLAYKNCIKITLDPGAIGHLVCSSLKFI